MPRKKKPANDTFYFSVDGETEKWYLEHLCKLVNAELQRQEAKFRIRMVIEVAPNPLRTPWRFISQGAEIRVAHLCDYETPEKCQSGKPLLECFQDTLDNMSAAAENYNLTYVLGYSNISFDLWMILHKRDCNGSKAKNDQYLANLNAAYATPFLSMKAYKDGGAFENLLKGIPLLDVRDAVGRATAIQQANAQNYKPQFYRNYKFFTNNPALSIHERIQELFDFCKGKGNDLFKAVSV